MVRKIFLLVGRRFKIAWSVVRVSAVTDFPLRKELTNASFLGHQSVWDNENESDWKIWTTTHYGLLNDWAALNFGTVRASSVALR